MISVIIPTYKEPEYLDLCLKSCIEGQTQQNEIIVVVDGFYNENKEVLDKWNKYIHILDLEENKGLPRGVNMGVYNASSEWILIVNDDNVFIKEWDILLNPHLTSKNTVFSINQVEPNPSIFPQFIIKDYGKTSSTFNLELFWNDFLNKELINNVDESGGTLPILITKENYMTVGGFDENYPTNGCVSDWDFFYKCEKANFKLQRIYNPVLYHFAQVATGPHRQESEIAGHEYFYYKWRKKYYPKALRS
jgi:glycosyltransferase involved in cell wall biosynthesis